MFVYTVQVYCHHLRDSASIGSFNFALIAIFVPTALPGYIFKTMTGFVFVLFDTAALFPLEFCPLGRKDGTKVYSEWNEGLHRNSPSLLVWSPTHRLPCTICAVTTTACSIQRLKLGS
jgi:hypothetical protein